MACRTEGRMDDPTPESGSSLVPPETRFGWRQDPVLAVPDPVESSSTHHLTSSIGPATSTPRPLENAPQPRFTPESVAGSLKPAGSQPYQEVNTENEVWWPEGSNRSIDFVGPAVRSIPQGNFTRSAMVAATVAAVASSTVLGPAMAGAVGHSATPAASVAAASVTSSAQTASDPVATTTSATNSDGMGGGGQGVNYTVQVGDTLHDIAAKYGVTTMAIIQANDLANPDLILPGEHVNVPADSGAQDVSIEVQPGDTINKLAEHYGVSSSVIINLASNKITNPDLIIVGQTLIIPGVQSSGGQGNAATASLASTGAPQAAATTTTASQPASTQQQDQSDKDAQASPAPQATTQATPAPTPPPAPTPTPQPAPAAQQPATDGFVWPTHGTITQNFGPTSFGLEPAYMGYAHFHQGLDIANSMYTPISAAASGTVIFSGWSNAGYGFCVQIDHGNGLVTLYGHMAQQPSVSVGEQVAAGQQIGKMGSTGASTGSHLHFAVQKNGTWVDPLNYLP